jgi:hypothetical protein
MPIPSVTVIISFTEIPVPRRLPYPARAGGVPGKLNKWIPRSEHQIRDW